MLTRFRLKPGRDDDLITWLNNLDSGDRSYHTMKILKKGLTASLRRPEAPAIKIAPNKVRNIKPPVNEVDLESAFESW